MDDTLLAKKQTQHDSYQNLVCHPSPLGMCLLIPKLHCWRIFWWFTRKTVFIILNWGFHTCLCRCTYQCVWVHTTQSQHHKVPTTLSSSGSQKDIWGLAYSLCNHIVLLDELSHSLITLFKTHSWVHVLLESEKQQGPLWLVIGYLLFPSWLSVFPKHQC